MTFKAAFISTGKTLHVRGILYVQRFGLGGIVYHHSFNFLFTIHVLHRLPSGVLKLNFHTTIRKKHKKKRK